MKKLMVAIVSAASAIFAFGDLPHGADFEAEGFVGGESFTNYLDKGDGAVSEGTLYWEASNSGEEIGTIAEYTGTAPVGVDVVPDIYTNALTNAKYLQLDSGKNRLLRNIAEGGDAVPMSTGDGIYLDTLVKFSAASSLLDSDSDFQSGDKLAIAYVGELDEGNYLSNFVVRAGVVGSDVTNYVANVPDLLPKFDVNEWYRLTIRTIADIGGGRAGFKIYINGKPMVYLTDKDEFAQSAGFADDTHTIFPSALEAGQTNADTITAVAFAGNGSIDDVVFTTETPKFIKDTESVVATFTVDSGVTAISVQVGEDAPIAVDMTADTLTASLPAGTTEFTVTATIDSTYTFARMTYGNGVFNANPAIITAYAGGAIAISTTRNNFNLFDANNVAISGTFETLAQAMAATGVAKIQLAYDYTETTIPSEGPVYTIADGTTLVLDLNGKTLGGGTSDENELFYVQGALTVIDSGNGGEIVYGGEYGIFAVEGDLAIGSEDDNGPFIDGKLFADGSGDLIRAYVKVDGNTTDNKLTWTVAPGSACSAEPVDGYWVVAPSAQPEPEPVAVPKAASNLVYDGTEQTGVPAGTGYTLSGDFKATNAGEYTATATLEDGYIWSDDTAGDKVINWSIAADTSATVVVTLTDYEEEYTAQLAFPTASATIGGNAVAGTSVWNPDTITEPSAAGVTNTYEVTFTVTGGNYAGSTGTATFKVYKAAGGEYPTYIDPSDTETKAKYDTWKETYGADTGSAYEDAFLLNCAPADVETAKANFKATITVNADGTVTVTAPGDYNVTPTIQGKQTLSNTEEWHTKTDGDKFFRAVLSL